jgi:glycerophosphoryl diester phosphodiesterase
MSQNSAPLDFSLRNSKIMVISHRGVWEKAPENSLLAVDHAIQAGADIVEIDTQKCSTGEFVVIHDETLDRTTNGTGLVSETSLEQIKTLRLRLRDGREENAVSDHSLPLLSELLEHAKGKIMVNIDTKKPEELPELIKEVERLNMQDIAIVKSDFNTTSATWDSLNTSIKHMPMLTPKKGQLITNLKALETAKPFMIELIPQNIEELWEAKQQLEKMDCRIWINTLDLVPPFDFSDSKAVINPDNIWGTLINAGVGAIQTDFPKQLAIWLESKSANQ